MLASRVALRVTLLALSLCPAALAQKTAGAETFMAVGQGVMSAQALVTNSTLGLESSVGVGIASSPIASPNYTLNTGSISILPPIGTSRPITFGASGGTGDRAGGSPVTVFGINFMTAGAGQTIVRIGGLPASSVHVVSGTTITAAAPQGVDGFGNPKGSVPVVVINGNGSSQASDTFIYKPALHQVAHAEVGAPWHFSLYLLPSSFYMVFFGGGLPGAPLPLPPFDGTLALNNNPVLLTDFSPTLDPIEELGFELPDDPLLVGTSIEFQALVFTSLFPTPTGTFTNVLPVDLLAK